jgi:uncharacterized protein
VTCTSCGATMDSTATSCSVCGAAIDGPSGASVPPSGASVPPSGGTWSPQPGAPGAGWTPPATHPSGLSSEVRNWGLAAHLSAFVGAWVALAFLGPLVVWMIKRDDHPFIEHHAKEALNFNLSLLLYGVVGVAIASRWGCSPSGSGSSPWSWSASRSRAWVVLPIVAAVKAANGEGYRYPVTIRFVS